jgi:hypothetical protein
VDDEQGAYSRQLAGDGARHGFLPFLLQLLRPDNGPDLEAELTAQKVCIQSSSSRLLSSVIAFAPRLS